MEGAEETPDAAPNPATTQATPSMPSSYRRSRLRASMGSSTPALEFPPEFDGEDLPEDTQDYWLEHVVSDEEHRRRTMAGRVLNTFSVPGLWLKRVFSYLATTPGKLFGMAVIVSLAIFAAGYSMSQSSEDRQSDLNLLLTTTEPMSYSAHNLYTSLSLADTIAANGFVQAGVESAGTRARYYAAIDRAMISAAETSSGIDLSNQESLELIADVERQVPIYTGLVETARANNRMDNPVGVAYMIEASSLMREEILPAAAELFTLTSSEVRVQQDTQTRPQWVPLSGLFAAVAFLLMAQWALWRMTRRRLNKGFLAATALLSVAIMWVSASNFSAWQAGTRGFEEASMPWDSLTASRIQAQQARTAETLTLVRRESINDSTLVFEESTQAVNVALDDFAQARSLESVEEKASTQELLTNARSALADWEDAHGRFIEAMETGNYDEAVRLVTTTTATPGQEATAAGAYDRLDSILSSLIADARSSMRIFINDGLAATQLVATAVLVLSLLSIVAVWVGMRPRLQEYL
ncbi:hypothetical protein C5L39_00650 [Corynebacterium alimapuense]|uniref:Phenol hydroxylase n=2 Tax=Corynebacterium alimapuense TaxID=1576874 RepID=A0A3M8K9K9_9CORY|nr:hypothetical protein C5L39_00650 [Corynebacterium alimapuense]